MDLHILVFKCPQCMFIAASCKYDEVHGLMQKHVCFKRHAGDKFEKDISEVRKIENTEPSITLSDKILASDNE